MSSLLLAIGKRKREEKERREGRKVKEEISLL